MQFLDLRLRLMGGGGPGDTQSLSPVGQACVGKVQEPGLLYRPTLVTLSCSRPGKAPRTLEGQGPENVPC